MVMILMLIDLSEETDAWVLCPIGDSFKKVHKVVSEGLPCIMSHHDTMLENTSDFLFTCYLKPHRRYKRELWSKYFCHVISGGNKVVIILSVFFVIVVRYCDPRHNGSGAVLCTLFSSDQCQSFSVSGISTHHKRTHP